MEVVEQQGSGLTYLSVHPDDYDSAKDYPLIILLHGFGANMRDLASLAPDISRQGYVYACPNGPLSVLLEPGMVGYAWTPVGGPKKLPDMERAGELLGTFFDEVMEQYRVPPRQALLMGFSQGGGMTYWCGLGRPELFRGLAVLSSALPSFDELQSRLPPERTQPIFISHGLGDPLISVERARESRAWLTQEGYSPDYREYVMAHEISPQVLEDLVPWIHRTLPPLD